MVQLKASTLPQRQKKKKKLQTYLHYFLITLVAKEINEIKELSFCEKSGAKSPQSLSHEVDRNFSV